MELLIAIMAVGLIFTIAIFGVSLALLVSLLAMAPFIGLYFLPTIIAYYRKHEQRRWIFALNFIFGSTGLGWVGTLVWSLLDSGTKEETILLPDAAKKSKKK